MVKTLRSHEYLDGLALAAVRSASNEVIPQGLLSSNRMMLLTELIVNTLKQNPEALTHIEEPAYRAALIEALGYGLSKFIRPRSSFAFYKNYALTMNIRDNELSEHPGVMYAIHQAADDALDMCLTAVRREDRLYS